MEDKISNTIFLKQQIINETNNIKNKVIEVEGKKVRFRIETKHWYGYSEPHLVKDRDILNISKETMIQILDEVIEHEKKQINKLIDMEIERKVKSENG